ncbi:hypothetical protein DFH09DRAFT_1340458 [Mycena vulgaris]|nr:hypothetical protein DFH09DRAFT_1340458 [Mycena vulgaris]
MPASQPRRTQRYSAAGTASSSTATLTPPQSPLRPPESRRRLPPDNSYSSDLPYAWHGHDVKAPALPPIPRPARPLQVALHPPPAIRHVLLCLARHLQLHIHILLQRRVPQHGEIERVVCAPRGKHIRLVPRVHHLGALSHSVSTATALESSTTKRRSKDVSSSGGSGGGGASKTSLLDKALRYLLDGDAAPDRSAKEIWLIGVRLPDWTREDEERVAAAASNPHSHSTSHKAHSTAHSTSHNGNSKSTAQAQAREGDVDAGFELIRDLPSLARLPPPLSFSAPPPIHFFPLHIDCASQLKSKFIDGKPHQLVAHGRPVRASAPAPAPCAGDAPFAVAIRLVVYTSGSNNSNASYASYNLSSASSPSGTNKKEWQPLGGTKGWTSDAGWGCMLSTG